MELIAHRGFSANYPENTLKAFRNAKENCAAVEFDVQVTKDRVPVVVHSDDLSKVSEMDQKVSESHWPDIRNVKVFDTEESIPTLRQTIDTLSDKRIIADLKTERGLNRVYKLLEECSSSVTVAAFNTDLLEPSVGTELSSAVYITPERKLQEIPELNADNVLSEKEAVINTADKLNTEYIHVEKSLISSSLAEDLQSEGYDVRVWTIRQDRSAWSVKHMNIQGVITDSPHFCRFV